MLNINKISNSKLNKRKLFQFKAADDENESDLESRSVNNRGGNEVQGGGGGGGSIRHQSNKRVKRFPCTDASGAFSNLFYNI